MAATGKTPILLYGSTTATNQPSAGNLTNSSDGCEIAINVADKNLFFKDSTNAVNTVPIRQSSGSSDGWLSSANWTTFNSKQTAYTNLTTIGNLANATGWLYNNGSGTFSYSTPSASDVGAVPTSRTVSTTSPLAGGGALSSNLTLSITQATTSTNGYLSSTDWNTFNNKQAAYTNLTSIGSLANSTGWLYNNGSGTFSYSTPTKTDVGLGNVTNDTQTKAAIVPNTAPSAGQMLVGNAGGTAYAPVSMSGDATLASTGAATLATVNSNVGSYTNASITVNAKGLITAASSGTAPVTSVTGTAPVVSSGGTTPAISMAAATGSVNGYLTSTDWTTFNSKQAALVSGTNIKTVSGTTLLGSGDLGTIGTGYGGTGLTSFTANGVVYASSTSALTTGTNLVFDGTALGIKTGANALGYNLEIVGTSRVQDTFAQNGYEVAPGSTNIITSYNRTTATWLTLRQRALLHEFYSNGSLAASISSTGNVTVSTGNLVIGTSGKGIDFSATSDGSGTATSELLADYEEGTWTPTVSYSTSNGDLSHSVQVGKYIKVGNLVTITGYINFSETTANGNLSITGLPYTSANVTNAYSGGALRPNNLTGCTDGTLWTIAPNATVMTITYANAGNPANVTNTNTGAGSSFYFSCSYQTA